MGKLINRIPGSHLLISSLPGSALRTDVESRGKPRDASRCQQAFSKPCLVNLISKDTHLVFSIYYIPTSDTTVELSVFWLLDTESLINELRFSESISLSFKTRLTSVTCFCGDVT